ncbi:hypothetical protein WA556_002185, partial [Blastocystis sp. ATCC 50177/Nand II]
MEQAIASLRTRGLNLKREWIQTVLPKLGDKNLESELFETALVTDLPLCSNGLDSLSAPKGESFTFEDCAVFQIQSVANIAMPVDSQFADSSNRMLKLEMTDGAHTCYAIEYSPIPALSVSLQKGYKVCVRNVRVVNRLWLLNASNTLFLGG